jgi:serine/threonine-protein kinase
MKEKTIHIGDEIQDATIPIDSKIQNATIYTSEKSVTHIGGFIIIVCDKCQSRYKVKKEQLKRERQKINCPECKNILTLNLPVPSSRPTLGQKTTDDLSIKFGKFRITGELGEGGMGKVYLAKDTRLKRNVAIKVLKDKNNNNPALFLREAQITAQLDHPNIAPIYTVMTDKGNDGNISFVMKHIKGQTLSKLIKKTYTIYKKNPLADLEKSLTLQSRLEYFIKVCEGVGYAHSKNVVHSDLKLSNITVGDYGEVYVVDWGISKVINDDFEENPVETNDYELEDFGETSLTIKYTSPEQINKKPIGTLSDIFSLGIILYELVTLKAARNASIRENINAARKGKINSISHAVKGIKIAPELKAIIQKATEYSPKNRYQSVEEFANDVRSFISNEEVSVQPYNAFKRTWRWMGKNKELAIIGALSTILLLSIATIWSIYSEKTAIKEATIREDRLTQLQADASKQAYAMDSYFLYIEGLLKRLAATTEYFLNDAPKNNERVFYLDNFKNPATAPSDYRIAPLYNKYVSFDYPVAKLAPYVKKEDVSIILNKLAPLRYHYFKAMTESNKDGLLTSKIEARDLLSTKGVPIRWVYLGTETGVMFSFPGKSTYTPEYDPRKRPWYALGANQLGVKWGNPYNDSQGQGLCLPCAISIYNDKGLLFGVMGMDITFSDIIRSYLTRDSELGNIEESYLLDEKGEIVISSNNLNNNSLPLDSEGELLLKEFPAKEVVDSVLKQESGLIELTKDQEKQLVVFYQLPSIQWYYVERFRAASVLNRVEAEWTE